MTMRPLCLLLALAPCAQAPMETLKVKVNLTNLSFTARDAQGRFVAGLQRDQVQVFEDSVPQKIAFFSAAEDLPLTLGLVVDVSGSQDHFSKEHLRDLEAFLRRVLRTQDRAFLVCFGNHLRLVSDVTNSPGALLGSIRDFDHHGGGRYPELGPSEERDLGTAFYDAIFYSITGKLADQAGRRALLVFSDGEDNSSSHNMLETIEAAQAANVQVYTLRYTERHHGQLTACNRYGIGVMDRMARETGAVSLDTQAQEPASLFNLIATYLHDSYELAYYPTNSARDGSFRKVVLKATEPGIELRSRTGYIAR